MASIASAPPWNPEDDLLLRHAIEAGASLEALARGAVLFSRRFSVQELQDRWRSLLYDADVSEQASERMTQFELANPNVSFKATKFGISKLGGKSSAVKRKGESVHRLYYDMRKRLCSFNTFGMNFIDEPNPHDDGDENMNIDNRILDESYMVGDHVEDYFELVDHEKNDPCLLNRDPVMNDDNNNNNNNDDDDDSKCDIIGQSSGDGLVEFPSCQSVEALGASHIMQDMPLWKTMEDVSAPEMPIDAGLDVDIQKADEDKVNSPEYDTDQSLPGCEINSLVSLSGDDFVDISDSLLNFTHENEHVAMDVGCENLDDKSRDVSDKPVQPSPQASGNENDAQKAVQPETSDPKTTLDVVSEDAKSTEKNGSSAVLRLSDGKQDVTPETNTPSIETLPGPCSPDFYFESMECTLNTEDPEIPCNDEPGVMESSTVVLPLTNQMNVVKESFGSKKGENIAASAPSQILGHRTAPKTNPSLKVVGCAVKPEPSDGNCLASTSGSQFRSAVSLKFSVNHGLKQEGIKPPVTTTKENAIIIREPSAIEAEHLEPETNPSPLYIDESEEELDREIDIPYFSDIENMILEMDLSPDDEESRFRQKVSKYQCEDAKRKIVRLEQCSRSSTQRAIASKGALGVLYGRHLKRYIKKTEVVLGRATEDNEVDIDLGEEGRANKISRRQALIKLEGDGSFFLKNIGKSSIFLNGKEVATGHRMCLSSSNLIEITGLSFVFEMNHKSIKRYLENLGQNSRGKHAKLEWSPTRRNQ